MQLKFMSINTQYGARHDSDGRPQDRWPGLLDIIISIRPHILLLQEARDWLTDTRLHADAEAELDMRALVAPSSSGAHTVVAYRTDTLRWTQFETRNAHQTYHGFGVAVLDLLYHPQVQAPLTVISAHLTPYSAQAASQEAQLLAARLYRYGGMGLIGGDINHIAPGDPEPDWTRVPPYNRSSRCQRRSDPDQQWRANPIVGRTLRDANLIDVANHLATTTDNTALLEATGHNGGLRVDQFWITPNLLPALVDYRRIDTRPYSDHDAITCTLDTTRIHARPLAWV